MYFLPLIQTILVIGNAGSWLYLGSIIGSDFLGLASFALALSSIVVSLSGFGMDVGVFYLKRNNNKRCGLLMLVKIASFIVSFIFITCFCLYITKFSFEYSIVCGLLALTSISNFVESRYISCESLVRASIQSIIINIFAVAFRVYISIKTESVVWALSVGVFVEIFKIVLLFKNQHYTFKINKYKLRFNYLKKVIGFGMSYYFANIYSVIYQKIIPVFATSLYGAGDAGIISAHISGIDLYSTFCKLYSQFLYKKNYIKSSVKSFELSLKGLIIFSWSLIFFVVVIQLTWGLPVIPGKIGFNNIYVLLLLPVLLIHAFGPIFTHWAVINNVKNLLPRFHFISLIALIILLLIFSGFGIVGVILAKSLSSFMGHGLTLFISRENFVKQQWRVLIKCITSPFSLGK
jgi:O-antigen/teichoic acid export membrane protein